MSRTIKLLLVAAGGAAVVVVLWYAFLEDWIVYGSSTVPKEAGPAPKPLAPGTGYQKKGTPDSGADLPKGSVEWGDIKISPWAAQQGYQPKSNG